MVLFVQLTLSTTKSAFHTLPHITLEMWSEAHERYLLGYPKLMSTDSAGRWFVTSSKTWAELEGDDAKEKLADLGRQGWLQTFKKFTFKPNTCRWETGASAADIDAWQRWCARSLLRLTRHSQLLLVSCSACMCSCRCPPHSRPITNASWPRSASAWAACATRGWPAGTSCCTPSSSRARAVSLKQRTCDSLCVPCEVQFSLT